MPKSFKSVLSVIVLIFMLSSCEKGIPTGPTPTGGSNGSPTIPTDDFLLPNIDLSNWKVTLPIPRADGKPLEVKPPEILDYATNAKTIHV
jgi:hypothetical protein